MNNKYIIETDIYGNIALHQAVSQDKPDIEHVKRLLSQYKEGASILNQFNRIPLHYVLDRSSPSLEAVKLLMSAYPEGVIFKCAHSNTLMCIYICYFILINISR